MDRPAQSEAHETAAQQSARYVQESEDFNRKMYEGDWVYGASYWVMGIIVLGSSVAVIVFS